MSRLGHGSWMSQPKCTHASMQGPTFVVPIFSCRKYSPRSRPISPGEGFCEHGSVCGWWAFLPWGCRRRMNSGHECATVGSETGLIQRGLEKIRLQGNCHMLAGDTSFNGHQRLPQNTEGSNCLHHARFQDCWYSPRSLGSLHVTIAFAFGLAMRRGLRGLVDGS